MATIHEILRKIQEKKFTGVFKYSYTFKEWFSIYDPNKEYEKERDLLGKAIDNSYYVQLRKSKNPQETIGLLIQEFQDKENVPLRDATETLSYLSYVLGRETPEKDMPVMPQWELETIADIQDHQPDEQNKASFGEGAPTERCQDTLQIMTSPQTIDSTIDDKLQELERRIHIMEAMASFQMENIQQAIKRIIDEKLSTLKDAIINNPPQAIDSTADEKDEPLERERIGTLIEAVTHIEDSPEFAGAGPRDNPESPISETKDTLLLSSTASMDGPVSDFNAWAVHPNAKLPPGFYYLSSDMRIKRVQSIRESTAETRWIANRQGKRYLFPNPNMIDQMTDISELYTMDGGLLQPRGHNSIAVLAPCEMSANGYIEYQGKLRLL